MNVGDFGMQNIQGLLGKSIYRGPLLSESDRRNLRAEGILTPLWMEDYFRSLLEPPPKYKHHPDPRYGPGFDLPMRELLFSPIFRL